MRQLNFLNRMLPVLAAIALSACGGAPSESDHIGKQTNSGAIRIWSYVSIRNPGSEERRQHVQIENESEVRSIHPLGFEIFLTAFITTPAARIHIRNLNPAVAIEGYDYVPICDGTDGQVDYEYPTDGRRLRLRYQCKDVVEGLPVATAIQNAECSRVEPTVANPAIPPPDAATCCGLLWFRPWSK